MHSCKGLLAVLLLTGGVAFADGFKNLQILPKTISREQLKAIMKAQAKSLGVECDHCHAVPDMASDENKNKEVARQMLRMTEEINAKWLKGMKESEKNKVTCGTCHRGHEEPPAFVAPTASH